MTGLRRRGGEHSCRTAVIVEGYHDGVVFGIADRPVAADDDVIVYISRVVAMIKNGTKIFESS